MELAGIPIWVWLAFLGFVLGMLALDLGVFHRQAHEVSIKEAIIWSGVWIGLALLFNLGIYFAWDVIYPASQYSRTEASLAFLTGYLVEKALSVDNIFVFLMVFTYFGVPNKYQHRVLFWGILGALVFRAAFIATGDALLKNFAWMILIFGGFLIFTGVKMISMKDKKLEPDKNPLVKLVRRIVPVTPDYVGQKFFTRIDGRLWATPLFICLVFIEFTDIIFALDSIPAIFAITREPFIVFTSNVFAILGLRALFFAVAGLMRMFHYLGYGLAAILVFVGGKMCFTYYMHTFVDEKWKFPITLSLGIILGLLVISMVASWLFPPKDGGHGLPAEATKESDEDHQGEEIKV
ncbi:MAG: TerC family protein [Fimbriimonadaceae bacterium]|jgi:tellurite resistance protein TerC|nr:TerC family protein [Fimbriimonadaceae bacterium]